MNNHFRPNCNLNNPHIPSIFNRPVSSNNQTFRANRNQANYQSKEQNNVAFQNQQAQKTKLQTFQLLNELQLKHIFQFIEKKHLKEFLLTLSSSELRQSVRRKQEQEDAQFEKKRQSKNFQQQINKKNILDLTVFQVFKRWHDTNSMLEKLSYDFQKERTSNGIKNHPKYGMAILQREPDKYYLGKRSQHYNRTREIEAVYRQLGYLSDNVENQQESSQQAGGQQQNENEGDESDEMQDFIEDDDAPIQYETYRKTKKSSKKLKKSQKKINSNNRHVQEDSNQQQDEVQENSQQQQNNDSYLKQYLIEQHPKQSQSLDKNREDDIEEDQNNFQKVNKMEKNKPKFKKSRKMQIDSD